jgi:hypothetical protein
MPLVKHNGKKGFIDGKRSSMESEVAYSHGRWYWDLILKCITIW